MALQASKFLRGMMLPAALWAVSCGTAFAQQHTAGPGEPSPWQIGLPAPATPVMEYNIWFHNLVMWIISGVVILIAALLLYVIVRFNHKANPVPSKITHHTGLEVAWTIIPIFLLVVIAIPSFRLLYMQEVLPKADLTIKAIASQWSWDYEYPDNGDISFTSAIRRDEAAVRAEGKPWLLTVDNEVVVPVNKVVRVQVTSSDVVHSFAMAPFGIKVDAIPGRLNETWFKAEREGWYYGQCSHICGRDHAFMPIVIRVVSEDEFNKWTAGKKTAMSGPSGKRFASVAPVTQ